MWECALVRPGFSFGSTRCERQVQRDCSSWVRARRKIGAGSWLPLRCKEIAPFSTSPPILRRRPQAWWRAFPPQQL